MSTGPDERGLARFARAIERRWARCLDRPVVLSPRDWARITDWHARGIPLQLVLEAIDAAFEPRRRGRAARPRALSYLAPSVEESFQVLIDGRRATGAARSARALVPLDAWRKRRESEPAGSALAELLERLVRAAESGRAADSIDAALDDSIVAAASADLVHEAERAAERDRARLRGRVPDPELERARSSAVASWLRKRLGLPRLSGPAVS